VFDRQKTAQDGRFGLGAGRARRQTRVSLKTKQQDCKREQQLGFGKGGHKGRRTSNMWGAKERFQIGQTDGRVAVQLRGNRRRMSLQHRQM